MKTFLTTITILIYSLSSIAQDSTTYNLIGIRSSAGATTYSPKLRKEETFSSDKGHAISFGFFMEYGILKQLSIGASIDFTEHDVFELKYKYDSPSYTHSYKSSLTEKELVYSSYLVFNQQILESIIIFGSIGVQYSSTIFSKYKNFNYETRTNYTVETYRMGWVTNKNGNDYQRSSFRLSGGIKVNISPKLVLLANLEFRFEPKWLDPFYTGIDPKPVLRKRTTLINIGLANKI